MSESDTSKSEPESLLKPRPVNQTNIRLKLMMLVGMLFLVGYAMLEAGKPENWMWMGFDDSTLTSEQAGEKNQNSRQKEPAGQRTTHPSSSSPVPGQRSSQEAALNFSPPKVDTQDFKADYPPAAVRFWNSHLARLSPAELETLLNLIRRIRTGTVVSEKANPAEQPLVENLKQERAQYHQGLMDDVTLMPDKSPRKSALSEEHYESEQIWLKNVLPAMSSAASNEDVTLTQQQVITRLQTVVDQILYARVEDRSSLGWRGDAPVWLRLWEQLQAESSKPAEAVTRLELMSQPELFRGQPVKISGTLLRAARKPQTGDSRIGLDHYFELWIQPSESEAGPYCVFSATLPDRIPEPDTSFEKLEVPVVIEGLFFKVRSYLANDSSARYCPVLVSATVTPTNTAAAVAGETSRWWPSQSQMAFILGGLLLGALGIAWLAFRDTQTRDRLPRQSEEKQLAGSFKALQVNPEVQTDQERIQALNQDELSN